LNAENPVRNEIFEFNPPPGISNSGNPDPVSS
jgi:hypothetical protein